MSFILLISPFSDELATSLASTTLQIEVICAEEPSGAAPRLNELRGQPVAILADGRGRTDLADFYRQLSADGFAGGAPLIALLTDAGQRQTALLNGAQGWLLLPLLPVEVEQLLQHLWQFQRLRESHQRVRRRALEMERLATIGRLAASIVHSISNPMQAMRGALTLALEDSHNPQDVEEYVRLTQQELERVARLVNRMRQLYRPQTEPSSVIYLTDLLRDTFDLAKEETMRQKVKILDELSLDTPSVSGVASRFHLAFLSIILNLTDAVGALGGGTLRVTTQPTPRGVRIDFSTNLPILANLGIENEPEAETLFGLSPLTEVINTSGGHVQFVKTDQLTSLVIEIPTNPTGL